MNARRIRLPPDGDAARQADARHLKRSVVHSASSRQPKRRRANHTAKVDALDIAHARWQTMSAAVANALPPSILALFAPRPPIEYKPPILKRKCRPYSSMASLVSEFEDPAATAQLPAAPQPESKEARRERIAKLRAEQAAEKVAAAAESYDPNSDGKIKGDPYKTLFVARTSYDSTEAKIKKEFEHFGPIKRIRLVFNTDTGRPRGYAFIEYEQERDMKTAYK